MISIRKYDVGFGDFLSVSADAESPDNNLHLVIDCGSNIVNSTVGKRYIREELSLKSDVVLTHFHSDHYSILYNNCSIPFNRLFVRKPQAVDGIVDFIAIACMKVVCSASEKELYSSSAWFIVNIISNLEKLNSAKIIMFNDGDIIAHNDTYYIKVVDVKRKTYSKEMSELFSKLGPHKSMFLNSVKLLSKMYMDYCDSQKTKLDNTDAINNLLYLRDTLFYKTPMYIKHYVDRLYDLVVNETSAIIGVWKKERLVALFLGDISLDAQEELSAIYQPVLLKLSHHGTKQYNSVRVLQKFNSYYNLVTYGYGRCRRENKLLPELMRLEHTTNKGKKYTEIIIP